MTSLQTVILTLSIAYAVIGALLLVVLVYARLHWSLKAVAVVVTSAFYVVSFTECAGCSAGPAPTGCRRPSNC